ncbi:MAG: MgtC/SapB family protein [Methylococcales bacterium]|nr:MgtC/SapB family protein [Methylococcales bacterium]
MAVDPVDTLMHLLLALAIGLVIGIERGWQDRDMPEGQRLAGVRTFALLGLLGGGATLLASHLGGWMVGISFLGVCALLIAGYLASPLDQDRSLTTLVAALLVFVLGGLAVHGHALAASTSAVIGLLILSYKPTLHHWLHGLERQELSAGIQLLLISVVMLPLLPNQGYGPWQILNPYRIWWMVVIIALISFAGYFAIRIIGARRGLLATGLFGGLASSTAVTLHLSRLGKKLPRLQGAIASGILLACGTMYLRMMLVVALLHDRLLADLWLPVSAMALLTYAPILFYWRHGEEPAMPVASMVKNPLELVTAIGFGLLLMLVTVLGAFLRETFGDAGLFTLATVSGVADVDAVVLSLIAMARESLSADVFVKACVLAAATNSVVKAGLASSVGGLNLALRVAAPLLGAALLGVVLVFA